MLADMLERRFVNNVAVESAATSTEEIGNPVHPGTAAILRRLGIDCSAKRARQLTKADGLFFDMIIGMDSANLRNITRIIGDEYAHKIHKLLDFTDRPGDVADPWYTGEFELTYFDVREGCEGLLKRLHSRGIF